MNDIYRDIATRTGGEILIGVVGPVRSGKSTFITRFMNELVIPNITGKSKKSIATDELPQSAQGKTVMTTEPKFVPGEAVNVKLDKTQVKIRLIDCVGYMIDGAMGHEEDGAPRMVKTPWSEEMMPFEKAGEYGTHKVIAEHSTIGIVVTSDGSFTDIDRGAYKRAEERVVDELKSLNKPFIVLFNTSDPTSDKVKDTCRDLQNKYGVAVVATKVTELDKNGIEGIFEKVLMEFPLKVVNIDLPRWVQALPADNDIITRAMSCVRERVDKIAKMASYRQFEKAFDGTELFGSAVNVDLDMAEGGATLSFEAERGLFYKVLADECGKDLVDEFGLLSYVRELKSAKDGYDKIKSALDCSLATGYGIVPASLDEATVEKPVVVKKNGQYCVKIHVGAESLHFIKAEVHTDVDVISGSKEQCDGFAENLSAEEGGGLETEVFGRTVRSTLEENLAVKCGALSENVKQKLKRTVNKAVNERKNNLICILI